MRYEVKVKEIHVGYIVVEANDEKEAIKKAYDHLADVEDEFQTMYDSTLDIEKGDVKKMKD